MYKGSFVSVSITESGSVQVTQDNITVELVAPFTRRSIALAVSNEDAVNELCYVLDVPNPPTPKFEHHDGDYYMEASDLATALQVSMQVVNAAIRSHIKNYSSKRRIGLGTKKPLLHNEVMVIVDVVFPDDAFMVRQFNVAYADAVDNVITDKDIHRTVNEFVSKSSGQSEDVVRKGATSLVKLFKPEASDIEVSRYIPTFL